MKKQNAVIIVLLAIIVLLLVVLGTILFLRGSEDTWICEGGRWPHHAKPSQSMPQMPCGAPSSESANQPESVPAGDEKPELIGGRKDEHGGLTPAGYSWCEQKQKCLRVWEEDCPASVQADEKGIIEGSLSYPSEGIPEMKICAENITNKKLACTTDRIQNKKYTYGTGYKLEVPAGTYRVYASLLDAQKIGANAFENYRAYYSEFVTWGLFYG